MQGIDVPETDEELARRMRVDASCRNLNDFLEKFDYPLQLLQTREGIETAMYNLCEELREQGMIYAEIRFAPSLSCERGLTQEDVVRAALDGKQRSSLPTNIILSCFYGTDYDSNMETIRLAKEYLGKGVCAVDLAGAGPKNPTYDYSLLFDCAREQQIPITIHCGEEAGPDSVRMALRYGASRLGHGVRSYEDPSLVEYLAEKQIPLELCPTSNVQTCVFASVADMPIRTFLDAGVKITINTDDPAVEGTSLAEEWHKVRTFFGLTPDEERHILLNSIDAAFATDDLKERLRETLLTSLKGRNISLKEA